MASSGVGRAPENTRRSSLTIAKAAADRRCSSTAGGRRDSMIAVVDETKMWSNSNASCSVDFQPGHAVIGPLCLILVAPTIVMVLQHVLVHLDGSLAKLQVQMSSSGIVSTLYNCWPSMYNVTAWKMIAYFITFEAVLMRLIPCHEFHGPPSPAGFLPTYRANGMQCYVITMVTFLLGAHFRFYQASVLYDHIAHILAYMNVVALLLCFALYLKGRLFPSGPDAGSTGHFVFDYYWGIELHPRVLGWDVKQLTKCRCGMMLWAVLIVSCALKQREIYGQVNSATLVNLGIQLVYITKFFWWETGYLASIDIMYDRAGFYNVWGVLVWLPCIYTSHSMYLVSHPANLSSILGLLIFSAGIASIYVNYASDEQKQHFRAVGGNCKIWGKDPYFIEAKYLTETGEKKCNLLLGCGWWGISRHFHYIPEVCAAFCWTVPVWSACVLPYIYVLYISIFLVYRSIKADARCRLKYGRYWDAYCKQVPWTLIPGIF